MSLFPVVFGDQGRGWRHSPLTIRVRPYGYNSAVDEVFRAFDNFASTLPRYTDMAIPEMNQAAVGSGYKLSKDGLEVKLDVTGFKPEELDVKIVENFIVIKAKHEERQDEQGFLSRSFVRRYTIPDSVKSENVNCSLTSDGFLMITAPVTAPQLENERSVPITLSGQPAPSAIESNEKGKATANPNGDQ